MRGGGSGGGGAGRGRAPGGCGAGGTSRSSASTWTSSSGRTRMTDSRALFVGRFRPFHKGHLAMAKRSLAKHDDLIIGIGSAQYSHTGENPFTAAARLAMLQRAVDGEGI